MTRRAQPIPPFSRLERAALQALAWELAPAFPQLEGLTDEATPGRYFQGPSSFVRRTGMARVRPGAARGENGLFGSVHAMIDGLADPIALQLQLRRGRLVALFADAYGQDLTTIDLANARVDQLFYLDDAGRSHPMDSSLYRRKDRSAAKSRPGSMPTSATPASTYVPASAPPATVVHRPSLSESQPTPVLSEAGSSPAADRTTLRIGIWVGLFTVAAIIGILTEAGFIFPLVGAFWLARLLTQPKSLDRIQQALADRRARQMG